METALQITGAFLLALVYFFYLKQTIKGESTPNPGTWIVWFVIMGINTFTYFKVVDTEILKTAIVFVGFLGITSIMLYSLVKGKFAKLAKIDLILLILSVIIGIFWQVSDEAKLSNLLLQVIIFISFLPTAIGLAKNRLKEKHWPWTLAVLAYLLQTISLLINYDGNLYQLALPVINGILGNGLITIVLICKTTKKERELFKEKIKDLFIVITEIFLVLLVFSFFAFITALIGKLVNYSPWSLLFFDIIFLFVAKFSIKFFHNYNYNINRKVNISWAIIILIFVILGVMLSIGVSIEHPTAILNIIVLIFLSLYSLISSTTKDKKV